MFQGIMGKVQGADHVKADKPCQDAVNYYLAEKYAIAVVADGHGGKKYIRSEIGSEYAVKAAIDLVNTFMENYDAFSEAMKKDSNYVLRKMQEQFFSRWTDLVEQHFKENPLTQDETEFLASLSDKKIDLYNYYGSTVLVAVVAEDYYYGLLVGDGALVVVKEDCSTVIPIDDPNSYANYVSSICQSDAINSFQGFYEEGRPLSLIVSSDGLIKSFADEKSFLDYHLMLTRAMENPENCQNSLMKNITTRSQNGSGDDVSVAAVFDLQFIKEKLSVIIAEMERRKAERDRIAEAKRQAAEMRRKEMEQLRHKEEERIRIEAEKARQREELCRQKEAQKRELEEMIRKQEAERQALLLKHKEEERAKIEEQKQEASRRAMESKRAHEEAAKFDQMKSKQQEVVDESQKDSAIHVPELIPPEIAHLGKVLEEQADKVKEEMMMKVNDFFQKTTESKPKINQDDQEGI